METPAWLFEGLFVQKSPRQKPNWTMKIVWKKPKISNLSNKAFNHTINQSLKQSFINFSSYLAGALEVQRPSTRPSTCRGLALSSGSFSPSIVVAPLFRRHPPGCVLWERWRHPDMCAAGTPWLPLSPRHERSRPFRCWASLLWCFFPSSRPSVVYFQNHRRPTLWLRKNTRNVRAWLVVAQLLNGSYSLRRNRSTGTHSGCRKICKNGQSINRQQWTDAVVIKVSLDFRANQNLDWAKWTNQCCSLTIQRLALAAYNPAL